MTREKVDVGFQHFRETAHSVYRDDQVIRSYPAFVNRVMVRPVVQDDSSVEDVQLSNQVSFLTDWYSTKYIDNIRFVRWRGNRFRVRSVTWQWPRIVLEIGAPYPNDESGV
nr:MAG TPA: hypothetical protein [Caudoviricetes sp.]